jgi:hypothetical protein
MVNGIMDVSDVQGLRNAVFSDSWGREDVYGDTLPVFSVTTTMGCFLALFVCRDNVDLELLRVVPVPAFDVKQFAGRLLIFPV